MEWVLYIAMYTTLSGKPDYVDKIEGFVSYEACEHAVKDSYSIFNPMHDMSKSPYKKITYACMPSTKVVLR